MQQLEIRKYNRQEIADLLELDSKNQNFKRNLENKLNKWGYKYIYSKNIIEITYQPTTAKEKLTEIMIRKYKLDI